MSVSRRTAFSVLGLAALPFAIEDTAQNVGGDNSGRPGTGVAQFGADWKGTVGALRALADDIEKGGTYLQSTELRSKLQINDYLLHTLTIEFALDPRDDATRIAARARSDANIRALHEKARSGALDLG